MLEEAAELLGTPHAHWTSARDGRRTPEPPRVQPRGGSPQPRCKVQAIRDPCGGDRGCQKTVERSQRAHPQTAHHRGSCRRHPQGCSAHRHQASATKPNPRPEVDMGRGGGSRQLRRGGANLLLRARAAAASIAARLIPSLVAEGWSAETRPTDGTELLRSALGPCHSGRARASAVTSESENPQAAELPAQAASTTRTGGSDWSRRAGFDSPRSPHPDPLGAPPSLADSESRGRPACPQVAQPIEACFQRRSKPFAVPAARQRRWPTYCSSHPLRPRAAGQVGRRPDSVKVSIPR